MEASVTLQKMIYRINAAATLGHNNVLLEVISIQIEAQSECYEH
ncbi:MAG: hypothetical protein ACJAQ6_001475 [Arenicella sp.]|jgi:hypothetical protein